MTLPAWAEPFARPDLPTVNGLPLPRPSREWAWAGGTGTGVRVAVIDSGVDGDHPAVGGLAGSVAVELDPDAPQGVRYEEGPHEDFVGHGTACAAIIRSLSRKIRASLLSPRDLHLSFQQLALGAVVGACIGLFVAAPGSDASGESLLGPVALSASAISFVAGFGVEAVFQALEALITRIFNITATTPTGNRGDGLPGN